jgi:hypothetical protein
MVQSLSHVPQDADQTPMNIVNIMNIAQSMVYTIGCVLGSYLTAIYVFVFPGSILAKQISVFERCRSNQHALGVSVGVRRRRVRDPA